MKIFGKNVFNEVKTRTNSFYGRPADSVDKFKQKHIYTAAKYYIYKNYIWIHKILIITNVRIINLIFQNLILNYKF